MVFDFLVEKNSRGISGLHLLEYSEVECYKIPENRQGDVWNCVEELNNHFHKHDAEISFIKSPYIDFLNFDERYHPCVNVCKIPNTKTGKPAKYSYWLFFCMLRKDQNYAIDDDTFGEVFFYPSGRIGKARVIFWRDRKCYVAEFRSTKTEELYLWRVYTHRKADNKKIVLYENTQKA